MNIFLLVAPQNKVRIERHGKEVKMKYRFYQFSLIVAGFVLVVGCATATTNDLFFAAMEGHTDRVKALLEQGVDVNAKDNDGYTALFFAALKGHTDTVKALLEQGADVNAKKDGLNALFIAAYEGHTDTVKALLEQGVDVNAKDNDGITALFGAKTMGHEEIIRMLKKAGAK